MLKSKKGTVLGDFAGVVSNVFQTLPKPILAIIFLILILLIGSVIQWSLMLFGTFCDSNNNPVRIDFNILSSFNLLEKATELSNERSLGYMQDLGDCTVELDNGSIYDYQGNFIGNLNTQRYFYRYNICSACNVITIYNASNNGNSLATHSNVWYNFLLFWVTEQTGTRVCSDEAYPINLTQCTGINWNLCNIPEGFHYEPSTNNYVCDINNTCQERALKEWDSMLRGAGADYIYGANNKSKLDYYKDYTRAAGIECTEYKPKIAVFGIQVFDYKIWILLFLAVILMYMYFKIKHN